MLCRPWSPSTMGRPWISLRLAKLAKGRMPDSQKQPSSGIRLRGTPGVYDLPARVLVADL